MYESYRTKHRCLLSIEPYMFSGKEVGKLREKFKGRSYNLKRYLPDYCVTEENTIRWSENYHQFTGEFSNPDHQFIFFDISTADKLLDLELEENGFDDTYGLLSDIKNWEEIVAGIIRDNFKMYGYDDYKRAPIGAQYIVIDLEYYRCSYEYDEWDMDVDLVGYLDKNLILKHYEYEDKKLSGEN